jgi:hypothetical protein
MPFLHIFPLGLIFMLRFKFPKNIIVVLSIALINICFIQDSLALKSWKFGFEAEKNLWNKIDVRIENDPSFIKSKQYTLINIGKFPSYRPHYYYYGNKEDRRSSWEFGESFAWNDPVVSTSFFNPDLKYNNIVASCDILWIVGNSKEYGKDIVMKVKDEIMKMEDVYPAKNSVVVKDDTIILVFDKIALQKLKNFILNEEFLSSPPRQLSTITQIDFSKDKIMTNDIISMRIDNKDNYISLKCGDNDPHIVLPFMQNKKYNKNSKLYIEMIYKSNKAGVLEFFYDGGFGMSEGRSNSIEIKETESKKAIILPVVYLSKNEQLLAIRVDPPNDSEFTIFNIKLLEEKIIDKS